MAIRILLHAIAAAFCLQVLAGVDAATRWALCPIGAGFQPLQLVSFSFLHASLAHLVVNLAAIGYFGPRLERALGWRRMAVVLASSALLGGICQLAAPGAAAAPTMGASAIACGLVVASALQRPSDRPLQALALILGAWAAIGALQAPGGGGTAHLAHLGGLVGAWLALRAWPAP